MYTCLTSYAPAAGEGRQARRGNFPAAGKLEIRHRGTEKRNTNTTGKSLQGFPLHILSSFSSLCLYGLSFLI
jgi:hypothetical protein